MIAALAVLMMPAQYASAQLNASLGNREASTGCGPGNAFQGMASFGPSNEFGYPDYYADHAGIAMELCDDPEDVEPLCGNEPLDDPAAPPSIATGNFWHEVFYSLGNATIDYPAGQAILVTAVEGVMDNEAEAVIEGDQLVFSRIRHRIDLPNDPSCAGTYVVTHPYGTDTYLVTAEDITSTAGRRAVNATDDCLHKVIDGVITPTCGTAIGDHFTNIVDDTRSRINRHLTWDPAIAPAAPAGHAGNLLIPHEAVGSACGTNIFRVEGPCMPGGAVETNLFSVMGRFATQSCGDGLFDPAAGEACDDGNVDDTDCCSATCEVINEAAPCDDGLACTTGDVCTAGECVNTGDTCACGDVNGDGAVAISDALMAAQFQVGLRDCGSMPAYERCDITPDDGDGLCGITDALRMAQCQVGLIPCNFTCGAVVCAP